MLDDPSFQPATFNAPTCSDCCHRTSPAILACHDERALRATHPLIGREVSRQGKPAHRSWGMGADRSFDLSQAIVIPILVDTREHRRSFPTPHLPSVNCRLRN